MRPAAYPHPVTRVQRIETHISYVFLAGDFAYKLKKPIALGFLDFSTLQRRHHFCDEELRLNRRLADDLYLDVVAITGTPDEPRIGGTGPVLEYGVRMRRFAQEGLLDRQEITGELIDRLAAMVADFHARIPLVDPDSPYGTPRAVLGPMLDNLAQIGARMTQPDLLEQLARLERWTRGRWQALTPAIERRRREGHVRECHGDMHRGNIALVAGEIRIFDAIEFNPALRWIDTASEIAFLIMDLEESGTPQMARRLLNRYLERCGDYGALQVLDLYKAYRALVRAKVMSIRLGQQLPDPEEAARDLALCRRYLDLAESYTHPRAPRLYLASGLSGSGKSHLSRQLSEQLPLIHLRSDVERKRLFGVAESTPARSSATLGLYLPTATQWTYDRLLHLAERILGYGYDVLVDATFIDRSQRDLFRELARRRLIPVALLSLEAPPELLRERIRQRLACDSDASEANVQVMESQCAAREALGDDELEYVVHIDTSQPIVIAELLRRVETLLAPQCVQAAAAGPREAGAR